MLSTRLRRVILVALVLMEATLCGVGGWIFAVPFPERLLPDPAEVAPPEGWLVEATLAGEDHRFEAHRGVDGWAITRAAGLNVQHRGIYSGASTLSMQLVHLLDPGTPTRSVRGKGRQAVLALRLERRLSKGEILRAYLDRAPYGSGYVGAEAAAQGYFRRRVADLSPAQAALLAALPRAPSAYNPRRHLGRAQRRQRHLLGLMRQRGVLSEADYRAALAEPLTILPRPPRDPAASAARRWLGPDAASPAATLDPARQRAAQARAEQAWADLPADLQPQAEIAVVVLDVPTGEVRALVGSARGRWFNAALAPRPLGQAPTPLLLGLNLEDGDTLASLLPDLPQVQRRPGGRWALRAHNPDGRYLGPVRLREVIAAPRVAAAQHAWERYDPERGAARAQHFGLDLDAPEAGEPWSPARPLGGAPASLLELAAAWAALPRGGAWLPPALLRRAEAPIDALHPDVARLLLGVLYDEERQAPLLAAAGAPPPPRPVGLAAFHDDGDRDHRAFAFTGSTLVAAWIGRLDGRPLAAPNATRALVPLLLDLLPDDGELPQPPEGASLVPICARSGLRAAAACPHITEEVFLDGTAPEDACTWHERVPIDRRNDLLAAEACDPSQVVEITAVRVPPRWRAWAQRRGAVRVPNDLSPLCPPRGEHHLFPWPTRHPWRIVETPAGP